MNREIKFRAYADNRMWTWGEIRSEFNTWLYSEKPIMQYIGIKDRNGKEVYEGDILKVGENLMAEIVYIDENCDDYGDEINSAFHAKIKGHDKIIPLDGYLKKNCEVIGNVFENPELL
jgi:uncharacterized phage protein (TIGR01671 family)